MKREGSLSFKIKVGHHIKMRSFVGHNVKIPINTLC